METIRVKVIDFRKGVRYAKRMQGVYDAITKTWAIPADRPEIGNLKAYGLERVQASGGEVVLDIISDDRFLAEGDQLSEAMDDEHSPL